MTKRGLERRIKRLEEDVSYIDAALGTRRELLGMVWVCRRRKLMLQLDALFDYLGLECEMVPAKPEGAVLVKKAKAKA